MGRLWESFSSLEVGSVAFAGLVDDLLIFGKPSLHRAPVDHDERMDGEKLLYLLLLLLDGNPCSMVGEETTLL